MIKKILAIKNFGKFSNPKFGTPNWNGTLSQTNVIYAQNGSGKTTLSLLFRSLKENNEIISKKRSFSSKEPPEIVLLDEAKKEIKFTKGKWNTYLSNIEIFDSFFIEDNVYIITIGDGVKKPNFFEILVGERPIKIRKQIDAKIEERQKLRKRRANLRAKLKVEESSTIKEQITERIKSNLDQSRLINKAIENLEKQILDISSEVKDEYLLKINSYLRMFNNNLFIGSLTQKKNKVLYALMISGHQVRASEEKFYSLRYSLSEGDKNALALSFFFAKLDLIKDLSNYTVIIDDPITSFDYSRRNTTIINIARLREKVKCLILLTHDLNFASDFSRRINYDCQNLEIVYTGSTSQIQEHNIEQDTLTGIFKDLSVLHNYIEKGSSSELERREVIRCIRPVVEGIFRVKFFSFIQKNEWLGDIIQKIRVSEANSQFYRLKSHLPELIEINDYSKEYHHNNPNYLEIPINDEELRAYTQRTLSVIQFI